MHCYFSYNNIGDNVKLDIIDEDELVIYLKKYKVYNIDFSDEKKLEDILKKLFNRLNEYYDIKIQGYYNIDIYIDKNYGGVLKLNKEELEYYDYFDNQVDMKIIINKTPFMYQVEDFFDIDLKKYNVYKYLNNIYLLPKKRLSNIELAKLMENSVVIYDSDNVIKRGIKIK